MENRENEHGTVQPSQADDLKLDEIVNEFKDYTPEQEPRPEHTAEMHASAKPVKAAGGAGRKILIAALCVLGAGILGLGAYFGISALTNKEPEPVVTEAPTEAPVVTTEEIAATTAKATDAAQETTAGATEEETKPFEPNEMLAAAIADNPDVIGLLTYGNEEPLFITQCADNNYYLNRDYQKKSSWTGCPFLDYRCSTDPRDTNLMIHGHNMKNGTIFSNFKFFYQRDYIRSYPIVTFETEHGTEYYVIYAVTDVEVDQNSSTYFKITEWNFDTDDAFKAYTDYLIENSRFELPVTVEPTDELLTLSTCNYIGVDGRLLICCRKLHADESIEQIMQLFEDALFVDNAA